MSKFERTEEYIEKLTMDSFGQDVRMDIKVILTWKGSKLKAYAPSLKCYLQFPRNLRERYGQSFICDVVEATNDGRKFYRAYKGSIRDENGEIVG